MEQKKSTFTGYAIGTALLSSLVFFNGCDLAKPTKKRAPIEEKPTVEEVVQQPAPPPPPPPVIQRQSAPQIPTQQSTRPLPQPLQSQQVRPLPTLSQAQIDAGWTPEKMATVEQLKREIHERERRLTPEIQGKLDNLNNVDPILVGKHVVFSHNWIEFIGPKKPLSRQQFENWRDKIDKVYESYEELIGKKPVYGEKVLVNLRPFANNSQTNGLASNTSNFFCINNNDASGFKTVLREVVLHDSYGRTMMHELAHIFAHGRDWEIDAESITHVLTAYAMETIPGAKYGTPGKPEALGKTEGIKHRSRVYNNALKKYKNNTITASDSSGNAVELYSLGLVNKVADDNVISWDIYKQVFRSYDDEDFEPNEYMSTRRFTATKTRDLLDRIEHFSGKPKVLRTLPDNGALLDRFFNVNVVQRNLTIPSTAERNDIIRQMQYVQPTQKNGVENIR